MPSSSPLQVLLFDMDGVLVDVSTSYRRAIMETVEHFTGRQISSKDVQRYKNYGGFNDDWKLTHSIITDTAMEVPLSRVIDEFQRRYRGTDWDGFISDEEPLIDDATLDTIQQEGVLMGVVTGRPQEEVEWTIEHMGWSSYFPIVLGKEKQGDRMKPDPFPLNHTLTMLGAVGRNVTPNEAAYVGDSVDDMTAARAAEMWALGVVPPYLDTPAHTKVLNEAGAHTVLDSPNELPDLMRHFDDRMGARKA